MKSLRGSSDKLPQKDTHLLKKFIIVFVNKTQILSPVCQDKRREGNFMRKPSHLMSLSFPLYKPESPPMKQLPLSRKGEVTMGV